MEVKFMEYANEMKNAIKEAIENVFGEIDDCGCYNNGEWMSTESMFELICNVIDDNDYMFID
jgi:hypothetical protein